MSLDSALRALLLENGAALVGYGDLSALPEACREPFGTGMNTGIAVAVKMTPTVLMGIERQATPEYYNEKISLNSLLARLSAQTVRFLETNGYQAFAQTGKAVSFDRVRQATALPHKTVATRAGLGWIGNCALLVTEQFGSAVRLSSVLTDAPLKTAEPINQSRCGTCNVCRKICPAKAVLGGNWRPGLEREAFYDAPACGRYADKRAAEAGFDETLCGLCIVKCPWTQRYINRF